MTEPITFTHPALTPTVVSVEKFNEVTEKISTRGDVNDRADHTPGEYDFVKAFSEGAAPLLASAGFKRFFLGEDGDED